MRTTAVNGAKFLNAIVVASVVLALRMPAFAEDRMVLGPRQFERDSAGGAVLCIWGIHLSVQTATRACGLTRRPVDNAIDKAIAAIDEFILANSSLHPTRAMLEDFKRRAAESDLSFARQHGLQKFCESAGSFRNVSPEEIEASVKSLLAVPREPVMNPCL